MRSVHSSPNGENTQLQTADASLQAQLLAVLAALAEADARNEQARQLVQAVLQDRRAAEPRTARRDDGDPLLSLREVAAYVGLLLPSGRPANSLYEAIGRGELAAYRVSGRWRVRQSDLELWLERLRELPRSA